MLLDHGMLMWPHYANEVTSVRQFALILKYIFDHISGTGEAIFKISTNSGFY